MAKDIRSGAWSEPELDLIAPGVAEGETVLDVGANYGVWSYHLGRAVGPRGHVVSFEPVPFTFEVLRRVARLLRFRNVDLRAVGCGEEAGHVSFAMPVQDVGPISAGQAHIATRDDERQGRDDHVRWDRQTAVTCPIVAIDDTVTDGDVVSFLKADIEGAELFAFRGARAVIERDRPTVVAEINPWFLEGFDVTVEDLVSFFDAFGYSLYHYGDDRRLHSVSASEIVEDNYVFVHPSRADRFASLIVG